MLAFTF